MSCCSVSAVALEAIGVDLDVVLLGLAAEADDVDDARHLPELPLEDPVLRRLQIGERVALAAHACSGRSRRSRSTARAAACTPGGSWMN